MTNEEKREFIGWMLLHGGVVSHVAGRGRIGSENFYGVMLEGGYIAPHLDHRKLHKTMVMDEVRGMAYEVTERGKGLLL